jgi:uncharacterized membrane protein YeaQ/YmgE (transglycosylase-associated protein family)
MEIKISEIIVWLILGALAGSLAGMLIKRKRGGFGHLSNIGIGLVGAIIGGLVFRVFKIDLGLGDIAVSIEDLIAALIGSFIFIGILRLIQMKRKSKAEK